MRAFLDRRQAADYPTNERGLKVSWRVTSETGNCRRWAALSHFRIPRH